MGARIAAGLAVVALIAGSIYFVKLSQSSTAETAAVHAEAEPGKAKLSYDLKDTEPKIDFAAIPEVIAEIDGKPVKNEKYVKELNGFLQVLKKSDQPVGPEYMTQVQDQIREKIIDADVMTYQANKLGLSVDPAEVEANFEKIKASMGGAEKLQQYLQSRGLTEQEMKDDVSRNMLIRALLDKEIISKLNVTDEEAKSFYEENKDKFNVPAQTRASHILVMPEKNDDEAADKKAKEKAEGILAKLQGGADFAETAKAESDDKGSGAKGGDLGFFAKEEMVPEFAEVAFSLEPDKLSGLVKSQFGYHIIKVHERKPGGMTSFEDAKEGIIQRMKYQKFNTQAFDYLDSLYKDLAVKVAGADGKLEPIKPKPRPSHPMM